MIIGFNGQNRGRTRLENEIVRLSYKATVRVPYIEERTGVERGRMENCLVELLFNIVDRQQVGIEIRNEITYNIINMELTRSSAIRFYKMLFQDGMHREMESIRSVAISQRERRNSLYTPRWA